MPENRRIPQILKKLRTTYPNVKTQLKHKNPFQLLIATILSAQCTDRQVNQVTGKLFDTFRTPSDFAGADMESLEKLIRSTGFYHNKAKNIQACARMLVKEFDSVVPDTLEELIRLPGVGRKTANLVLGVAFGQPGVVVDTHVTRIAFRLGLTRHKDPVKIEFDLMEVIPKKHWNDFCLHLIYLGREYCVARKPRCSGCPLNTECPYPENTESIGTAGS
jgi:endonuclease-3